MPTWHRLQRTLAWLAFLAQLCLPVLHASAMAAARDGAGGVVVWCGDRAAGRAAYAALPEALRAALEPGAPADEGHASGCAQLCGHAAEPPLPVAASGAAWRMAVGGEGAPSFLASPLPAERRVARPLGQGPPGIDPAI